MAMSEFRTPPVKCPNCKKLLDAVTAVNGKNRPEEGDYTVCLDCEKILAYGKNLLWLRVVGDKEILAMPNILRKVLRQTQLAIALAKEEKEK